jgi:hypothetical protein
MQSRQSQLEEIIFEISWIRNSTQEIDRGFHTLHTRKGEKIQATRDINFDTLTRELCTANNKHLLIEAELNEICKNKHELDEHSNKKLSFAITEHANNRSRMNRMENRLPAIEKKYQLELTHLSLQEENTFELAKEEEADGWTTVKTTQETKIEEEFLELDDILCHTLEMRIHTIERGLDNLESGKKLDDIHIPEGLSGEWAEKFIKEWIEEREKNMSPSDFIIKQLDRADEAVKILRGRIFEKAYILQQEGYTKLENYLYSLEKRLPLLRQTLSKIIEYPPSLSTPLKEIGLFNQSNSKEVERKEETCDAAIKQAAASTSVGPLSRQAPLTRLLRVRLP